MAPVLITLFEHQFRPYSEIDLFTNTPHLRERVLVKLERLNETAGQEILSLGRKGLRANALVGVLHVEDITFEILPKIDYPLLDQKRSGTLSKPNDTQAARQNPIQSATQNLLTLLSYAYDLRLQNKDVAGLSSHPSSWIELLTHLFADGLQREILNGLAQEYISREEVLKVLRGRWDIQRQISKPAEDLLSFQVVYDDLCTDTPLNRVFRFVIEQLLAKSQNAQNLDLLRDLAEKFHQVTPLTQVSSELLASIHFNRLNERFQPAFNLARVFLSGNAIQLSAGDTAAYAFVFDMNTLFERFIAGFIARHRQHILPDEWHDVAVIPQSEGAGLYLAHSKGKNILRLRPDLLFKRHGQTAPVLITDAKYKRLNAEHRGAGIAPEDAYQMLAYSVRFRCPNGLLLYPENHPGCPVRTSLKIDSLNLNVFIATLDLHSPLQPPDFLIREFQEIFRSFI